MDSPVENWKQIEKVNQFIADNSEIVSPERRRGGGLRQPEH